LHTCPSYEITGNTALKKGNIAITLLLKITTEIILT
jgi:hypothetical protein